MSGPPPWVHRCFGKRAAIRESAEVQPASKGVPGLSMSMLGVCPSHAILLRQTIRKHLRRSRLKTFLNVFQRIRLRDFSSLRPLHLPAAPLPRNEGLLGQTPSGA